MLTSVQPRPIIVTLTLFVTIPWGHLTVLVYLDTLEMGQRVLVSTNSYSFIVIREWSGKAYPCKVLGDGLKLEVTMHAELGEGYSEFCTNLVPRTFPGKRRGDPGDKVGYISTRSRDLTRIYCGIVLVKL